MIDWEVEALNEDEAFFSIEIHISFFVNTFALLLFIFVSLCLKPSYIYSLSAYCFLGGERVYMPDRVPRIYFSV